MSKTADLGHVEGAALLNKAYTDAACAAVAKAAAEELGKRPTKEEMEEAAAAGGAGKVYSTEETRIGTWIDGKPLYRRYLEGTLPRNSNVNHIISFPAECEVKMYQSYFERSDGFSTGTFCSPNSSFNSQSWIDMQNHRLSVQVGSNYLSYIGGRKCWLIIEYTKTTDSAS